MELEAVQQNYAGKLISIKHISYKERLEELNVFSLERKVEIYTIIFIWKFLEGFVPNFGIESYTKSRTGHPCKVSKNPASPSKYRTRYRNSLGFKSTKFFNISRDLNGVDVGLFKEKLDLLWSGVPDKHNSQQGTQLRAAATKSLIHQVPRIRKGFK